jgi:glutamyl-tRNA(Gln) amidotransferase subunit E
METKLKAGLEIHQQLDTKKLFCSCSSLLRNDEPKFKIERKLNPVIGETGEIDTAALFEKSKNKSFIYEVYDTNCLVELDEEPPHSINQEALKIALQICLLLNCKIFPVTQAMRKTVIDGSNTSGFQRTLMLGYDGFIETSAGKVGIESVMLEEDAARPSNSDEEKESKIYKLDRLGIPLVEIATKPDLKSPEQVKEAALKIGEILRACKVKRGLGTIRQDLNISIDGGNRVEIKGFQDPKTMIKTVELEVQRQKELGLIHKAAKLIEKPFEEFCEVSELFKKTGCKLIKSILDKNGKAYAVKIPGYAGIFGKELYEGRRFGSEVSDYAKMYGVGGIIHSDEKLDKYNISEKEVSELKKKLEMQKADAFIVVAGEDEKAGKAIESAIKRIKMQMDTPLPREVRKSNEDGSTSFLRPMPTSSRMYPETDLELLKISRDLLNEAKKNLPKLREELHGYLKEFGLNEELIKLVLERKQIEKFKELIHVYNNPNLIAKILTLFRIELAVKNNKTEEEIEKLIDDETTETILSQIDRRISENDVKNVMQKLIEGKTLEQAMEKAEIDLTGEIKKLIKEKPNLSANAYMGLIMAKFGGQVSGKEVMDEIRRLEVN